MSIALTQIDFTLLWRYFSWANQSTAVIALFVGAMYLYLARKNYWISLIPGVFMLMATTTYILNAPIGFGMPLDISYVLATIISIVLVAIFFYYARRKRGENIPLEEQVANWQDAV